MTVSSPSIGERKGDMATLPPARRGPTCQKGEARAGCRAPSRKRRPASDKNNHIGKGGGGCGPILYSDSIIRASNLESCGGNRKLRSGTTERHQCQDHYEDMVVKHACRRSVKLRLYSRCIDQYRCFNNVVIDAALMNALLQADQSEHRIRPNSRFQRSLQWVPTVCR